MMPAHLRRATTRIAVRFPTEPFSPNGLVRVRNSVALSWSLELAGLAFCRVWCINAERMVVRIGYRSRMLAGPNGLFRGRNGVPLMWARVLAGAVWRVRRYMRKRSDFPNLLRLQMLTGWAFCRV